MSRVPRVAETRAVLEPAAVHALASLFDDGLPTPGRGDVLPPLWHWAALAAWPAAGDTGADGHPVVGGLLRDVGKQRRMFAGGRVTFHGPLLVGSSVRREERVLAVTPKAGRSGDFVLVQVESRIHDHNDRLALVEVQDLVYCDVAPQPVRTSPVSGPVPVAASLLAMSSTGWEFTTDTTKLMRFSSATCNGHRIHYDRTYAVEVERYPGLVVHGPLMTLALAEVLRLENSPAPSRLVHRNHAPMFCGESAKVVSNAAGSGEHALNLVSADGMVAASMNLVVAD